MFHFSEYDQHDINDKKMNRKLVNSLSQIPMFDQIKYSGEEFYKTSYGEQFPSKERFFGKEPEYVDNHYDFQGLSARLASRNAASSRPLSRRNSAMQSESYDSYNNDYEINQQLYKRPMIPPYIKRVITLIVTN
jgi:hypothetical protein